MGAAQQLPFVQKLAQQSRKNHLRLQRRFHSQQKVPSPHELHACRLLPIQHSTKRQQVHPRATQRHQAKHRTFIQVNLRRRDQQLPQPTQIMAAMPLLFDIFPRTGPRTSQVRSTGFQHPLRIQRLRPGNVFRHTEDFPERPAIRHQLGRHLVHDWPDQLRRQSH